MSISIGIRPDLGDVALNPQPLPPKRFREPISALFSGLQDRVALNPQPLPPKVAGALFPGLLDQVALGIPNPCPQRMPGRCSRVFWIRFALNPQPLPPKDAGTLFPNFVAQVPQLLEW